MSVNDINQKRKMDGLNADVIKSVFQELAQKGYGTLKEKVNKNGKKNVLFDRISYEENEAKKDLQDLLVELNILADLIKKLKSQKDITEGNLHVLLFKEI